MQGFGVSPALKGRVLVAVETVNVVSRLQVRDDQVIPKVEPIGRRERPRFLVEVLGLKWGLLTHRVTMSPDSHQRQHQNLEADTALGEAYAGRGEQESRDRDAWGK